MSDCDHGVTMKQVMEIGPFKCDKCGKSLEFVACDELAILKARPGAGSPDLRGLVEALKAEAEEKLCKEQRKNNWPENAYWENFREGQVDAYEQVIALLAASPAPLVGAREALVADLEKVEKALDHISDFLHGEDCAARTEEHEDEIDDNPLECLKGCDCGVAEAFKAWEIVRALRDTLKEEPRA